MKLIGGFNKYHGVCGINNNVSFVTNLFVLHVINAGKFRLDMNFVLSFIEEETNKLLRRSNMFHSLFQPWETHNTYETADGIS